jgi:hypothetical protein
MDPSPVDSAKPLAPRDLEPLVDRSQPSNAVGRLAPHATG